MIQATERGCGALLVGYVDPMRIDPPREGMRPGTAAGDPQTLF
jgi:hypothetical protein